MIDVIEYIKVAESVGFTRDQAEFQAKNLNNELDKLITKEYFKEHLSNEFKFFEKKLTIKLGMMMLGCVGLMTFLLKH